MQRLSLSASAAAFVLVLPVLAAAQSTAQSERKAQPPAQQQKGSSEPTAGKASGSTQAAQGRPSGSDQAVAQRCVADLRKFSRKMDEEGYWLTGWGARWGYGRAPVAAASPATVDAARRGVYDAGPWGTDLRGAASPRHQIFALYQAARVLALRGDEQACATVLAELQQLHGEYSNRLRQVGVEPAQVRSWRQERIALAKPVTELNFNTLSTDDIEDTDVRNKRDEYLGNIEDVIVNPQDGSIKYVVIERGGFLGIGDDRIAVPWKHLAATPGLNTFVLDVPERVVENAPKLNADLFGDASAFEERRQQVERYWEQSTSG